MKRPSPQHSSLTLEIAIGGSNLGKVKNQTITWGELVRKLTTFLKTPESYDQFMALPKASQDELKNEAGFWLAAFCEGGRRAKKCILRRSGIALDIDYPPQALVDKLDLGVSGVSGFEHVGHSTRKHHPDKIRIRLFFPLIRPLGPTEYTAAARILAFMLDESMKTVDQVSFRLAQMMYLPTCSADASIWTHYQSGELLDGQKLIAEWGSKPLPKAEAENDVRETADKAEDPTLKPGLIGAFCRVYDVYRAMAELIPDVYSPSDDFSEKPRYTYNFGTSTSGMVVENDGLFIYSHHGSDPCADKLCNSWDMVRLHLFGGLDKDLPKDAKPHEWPSQKAMEAYAQDLPEVMEELQRSYAEGFDDETDTDEGEPPGTASTGSGGTFDPDIEDILGEPRARPVRPIDRMNAKHALAIIGGKTVILNFRQTPQGKRVNYSTQTDLNLFYANEPAPVPGRQNLKRGQWWLEHPQRLTFEGGVAYAPGKEVPADTYNLWGGWTVEPDPKATCKRYLHHLLNNICCKDRGLYDWLLNYFAHMIQKPWEKPGVALVMIGEKGTGKDTVGEYLGALFKQNHVVVSQMEHVTGKFNAHQETALLLHVQEAYWAGDPKATSALKALITSPTSMIEPKGINAFTVDSYCRILMTSNEEQVVNATMKERRFAVFKVSDAHARDTVYFDGIYKEMVNGGASALLHLLQTRDISGFDPRTPPITKGLTEQKIVNLRNVDLWWYECLYNGVLVDDFENIGKPWETHEQVLQRGELYGAYKKWLQGRPSWDRNVKTEEWFARSINKLCPDRKSKPKRIAGKVDRVDLIPSLPQARRLFDRAMEGKVNWPDELDPDDDLIG